MQVAVAVQDSSMVLVAMMAAVQVEHLEAQLVVLEQPIAVAVAVEAITVAVYGHLAVMAALVMSLLNFQTLEIFQ
jgi:hypothetical protein